MIVIDDNNIVQKNGADIKCVKKAKHPDKKKQKKHGVFDTESQQKAAISVPAQHLQHFKNSLHIKQQRVKKTKTWQNHDKIPRIGQLISNFRNSNFPLTCKSFGLSERSINPKTDTCIYTSCLWTMIDRTGPLESSILSFSLRLGLWPWESGTTEIDAKRGQKPQLLISLRFGLWPSESDTSEIDAKRGQNPQLLISLRFGLWPWESGMTEIDAKRGQKPQLLISLRFGLWPWESGMTEIDAKRGQKPQLLISLRFGLWP